MQEGRRSVIKCLSSLLFRRISRSVEALTVQKSIDLEPIAPKSTIDFEQLSPAPDCINTLAVDSSATLKSEVAAIMSETCLIEDLHMCRTLVLFRSSTNRKMKHFACPLVVGPERT